MEQGQCWNVWTKRKYSVSSNLASYEDSWEEQAFAEDAAGGLGGCTWPPRSYSCSFCSREFKSAQALGGHMNVHRRDRARLKQPRSPQNNEILYHHHQNPLNPSPTNPNSDPSFFTSSPPSPSPNSKDLAPSINGNICGEEIFRIPHNSPLCSSKSWSNVAEDRSLFSHKFDLRADNEKMSKLLDSDLSISSKRIRRTDASSVPFFPNSITVDHRHHIQSKMLEFNPSSIEELDLELRLGHSPKV